MQKNKALSLLFFIFLAIQGYGQTTTNVLLKDALLELSKKHRVQFNYQSDLLDGVMVILLSEKSSLVEQIQHLETETSFRFSKIGNSIFTITKVFKICGHLVDSESLKTLEGATIRGKLENTISSGNGFFELTVSSLEEEVEIRFLGYKTLQQHANRFINLPCTNIPMQAQEEEMTSIVLESYLVRGIDKKRNGNTTINFSKFSALPGLTETDVLQTVQALPGIVSIDETVSNINIRGGSHDQNLIQWDDIKMYQSGHFFGLISSFNPQITKTATVITNGSDASDTDGVSGTIKMNTDPKIQKKYTGSLGINFISADFFADVPLGKKSSFQFSARRSVNDWISTPTYKVYFDRVTQQTEIANNVQSVVNSNKDFNFYDSAIRWLYHPSKKDRIRFNFILIDNELSFDETSLTNSAFETKKSSLTQNSLAVGLKYERDWSPRFSTNFKIYNSDYKLLALNANVLKEQRFLQKNTVSETGIKFKGTYHREGINIALGHQFIETKVVNENDIDIPRFLRRDAEVLREQAFFIQSTFQNKYNTLFIKPGVRINYIHDFDVFLVEPRLSLRKILGASFQIEALGEMKHQSISQVVNFQNDFLGVEKRRWQLADNLEIPILKSKQASFGMQYSNKGWLVDATGYIKAVDGITSQSQSFTTKYEFEKTKGSYHIYGIDFLVRKQVRKINSWFSYSFMSNSYTFDSLEEHSFPSNFDTTHSFTFGTTYTNKTFHFSGGFNFRTGKPTSIPIKDQEVTESSINFGKANSTRITNYFRADLSAIYKLKITKEFRSEMGFSIWNAFNTKNTINHYYRIGADQTANSYSRLSLGITTNFVLKIFW